MKTIVVCSSVSFYQQVIEVEKELGVLGYKVIVPKTAHIMRDRNDFEVSHYKTWFADDNDYHKKGKLMRAHFDEISKGDAVLVLNHEKHSQPNYIGGNVLLEMGLAFYLNKPIYILNDLPEASSFLEEIRGFEPIVLHGQLSKLRV